MGARPGLSWQSGSGRTQPFSTWKCRAWTAKRSRSLCAQPILIALSGNVVRLAQIRGNGAFDHHFGKPADVDGLVGLLKALS